MDCVAGGFALRASVSCRPHSWPRHTLRAIHYTVQVLSSCGNGNWHWSLPCTRGAGRSGRGSGGTGRVYGFTASPRRLRAARATSIMTSIISGNIELSPRDVRFDSNRIIIFRTSDYRFMTPMDERYCFPCLNGDLAFDES